MNLTWKYNKKKYPPYYSNFFIELQTCLKSLENNNK